jgi:hypothetical protein
MTSNPLDKKQEMKDLSMEQRRILNDAIHVAKEKESKVRKEESECSKENILDFVDEYMKGKNGFRNALEFISDFSFDKNFMKEIRY